MELRLNNSDSDTNKTLMSQPFNHPMWIAFQAGLWSCLTVLSVTGNMITLMCIWRGSKRLQSSMYAFYASLATADCLVGKLFKFKKVSLRSLSLNKRTIASFSKTIY